AVDVAYDGGDALERTAVVDYDVVVLDRDLPVVHGDQVCRTLVAADAAARGLMLPASGTVAERVEGLGLGADDYLPKPFAFAELVTRIRALTRRAGAPLAPILEHGDLPLGPARGPPAPLPKPFAFAELVARIRALTRRAGAPLPPILQHGDLRLDPAL